MNNIAQQTDIVEKQIRQQRFISSIAIHSVSLRDWQVA